MLQDSFGRQLKTLRISVTDRCNLRCRYCMPPEGVPWLPREDILRLEETARLVKIFAGLGIRRVKITGGEPLVRDGLEFFIAEVTKTPGICEVSLITNGLLLEKLARPLADAGLKRVTVSLDSLDPELFRKITRGGELSQVLRGLEAAHHAGLAPLKVNCVMFRDNEKEWMRLAALAMEQPWDLRFIEYMPVTGAMKDSLAPSMSPLKLKECIEQRWGPLQAESGDLHAPARMYRLKGGLGRIGFISSVSEPFCASCDRLRLGAGGFLKLCMAQSDGIDLRQALRQGQSDDQLKETIRKAVWGKPRGHDFYKTASGDDQMMSRMGG